MIEIKKMARLPSAIILVNFSSSTVLFLLFFFSLRISAVVKFSFSFSTFKNSRNNRFSKCYDGDNYDNYEDDDGNHNEDEEGLVECDALL